MNQQRTVRSTEQWQAADAAHFLHPFTDFQSLAKKGSRIITKAENITFEAEALITVQMGAASLILTPASVSFTGVGITLDGDTVETGGMLMDN